MTALLVVLMGFLVYFGSMSNRFIDAEQLKVLITEIENATALPGDFYRAYEKEYPGDLERGLISSLIHEKQSLGAQVGHLALYYRTTNREGNRLVYLYHQALTILEIERKTEPKQRLNWLMQHFDFLYGNIGANEASRFYFDKELGELNSDELHQIVLMIQNPTKYNPKREK